VAAQLYVEDDPADRLQQLEARMAQLEARTRELEQERSKVARKHAEEN
jgi:hypothetical protein